MTNWLDFKELRKQLDFGKVLQRYGVELKLRGDQHHGFCPLPLHKGKRNSASFSANLKRKIWQCFGCGEGGNVLDFAVLMEGGNPKNGEDVARVARKLNEGIGSSPSESKAGEKSEETVEDAIINAPIDFELKGLDASHPYPFNRGFSKETVERFGLGFCSRGLLTNRLAIPLQDAEGKLVGYAGRLVDDKAISEENPKYKFPGRRKRKGVTYDFRKSLFLYNAHRLHHPVSDVVVVEGFPSVWWLTQAGIAEVVSPMGASCSKEQGESIVSLVKANGCVWIFTDDDAAGERCAHDVFSHVGSYRFVKRLLFKDALQPTDVGANALQEFWRWRHE